MVALVQTIGASRGVVFVHFFTFLALTRAGSKRAAQRREGILPWRRRY
jgi:hypothetical protein